MLPRLQSSSSLPRRRKRRGGPFIVRGRGGRGLPLPSSHESPASGDEGSFFCLWRCKLEKKINKNKKFYRGLMSRLIHRYQTLMVLLVLVLIFIVATRLETPQPTTMKLSRHAVLGTTTTPIYWINLDKSKDRLKFMNDMFSSLGLSNAHRVAAHDINSTWRSWVYGTLVFHPLIKLIPRTAESNKWTDHSHLRYYYEEAACTLSHLRAIKQAYDDGNEHALILEDDTQLSIDFLQSLPSFLKSAPPGWKVLQFSTNNVS